VAIRAQYSDKQLKLTVAQLSVGRGFLVRSVVALAKIAHRTDRFVMLARQAGLRARCSQQIRSLDMPFETISANSCYNYRRRVSAAGPD